MNMSETVTKEKIVPEPELLNGKNVLIMSASDWGDNAVSNMQIAAMLSELNTVVYIETMGGRIPNIREFGRVLRRLKSFFSGANANRSIKGLNPRNTNIVSPLAIPHHRYGIVSWFNNLILIWQVRRILKRFNMSKPIVWSFSPRWEAVIGAIEHELVVFHCVDALHTYDASDAFKKQLERVVRSANLVITPGVLLERELKILNPATYRIGHGCGADHLKQSNNIGESEDLADIPKPRAIYSGTLANWVDYPLLTEVARRLPKVSFVLIGYIHALAPRDQVDILISLPNVFHLGYKNFDELPDYYRGATVGLVPYQDENEHIQYSTPTKFLDYFAAGLPAVSTRYPASEAMGDMVSCASTPDEFVEAIKQAINENTESAVQRRIDYARNHTWEQQVAKMSEKIRERLRGG
jgi:glycosyltransferase involved in cell wall biosynthesis